MLIGMLTDSEGKSMLIINLSDCKYLPISVICL